ncbi:U11/U12 small nuclear ribonucleoprotein 25 kDa protein-like [Vitis riparia]|uniref:U11/U12 small nuclear ribonucleoprotein 25 kDa protein-like n=1 Tax=Vitis riparia TaxID=96939 RepID=UPI00155AA08E|nr:U11/U12 small nuclear ribonucleoprotein 25 kDa protein-like [Vitis riparia]
MPGLGPVFLEACMCGIASSSSPQPEDCGIRESFAYQKLPQQLLRLSVLKLDGSCFEIQVPKGASIAELKEAVVKAFGQTQEEGQTKISWSLVWLHFCLCYKRWKLFDDKMYIRDFRIKDGDQLQFVRHLSVNYNLDLED